MPSSAWRIMERRCEDSLRGIWRQGWRIGCFDPRLSEFWYVWKNQFQALAEAGYHVVAPTCVVTIPRPSQRVFRIIADVRWFRIWCASLTNLGTAATVVGRNWGGFVTWAVAEDFPDKVKKAVIVNAPQVFVFSAAVRSSFQQVRRSWYIGLFQLPWLPEWFMIGRGFKNLKSVLSNSSFQPLDIDRHVRAFQNMGTITGAIYYYRAAVRGYWSPAAPSLVPVELPVDLIWGELDTFLGRELAVISNTIASNVVIKLLQHCSHWPVWDDPKQFNAHLLESDNSHHAISAD